MPELIITPSRSSWKQIAQDMVDYRDLLLILAWREISIRYKQTALGVVWVVVQPLTMALIFALVLGRLAGLPSDGMPYLLFAYSGLVLWNLFSQSLERASGSIVADEKLVSKVYFPRWIIPLASVLSTLVDFGISLLLVLGLALYHGILGPLVLLLPLPVLAVCLCGAGCGMLLAGLNVQYRDFRYITPFLIQVGLFASPVFYPVSLVPEKFQWLLYLNPLCGQLELFRHALTGSGHFDGGGYAVSSGVAILGFIACAIAFHRIEDSLADVI